MSAQNTETSDECTQHWGRWWVHTTSRQLTSAPNRQMTSVHNTETGDERTQDKSSKSVCVLHIGWMDYTPFDTSYVRSQSLYGILLCHKCNSVLISMFLHLQSSYTRTYQIQRHTIQQYQWSCSPHKTYQTRDKNNLQCIVIVTDVCFRWPILSHSILLYAGTTLQYLHCSNCRIKRT